MSLRFPKPERRRLETQRRRRSERAYLVSLRQSALRRDGQCRLWRARGLLGPCEGRAELAHLHALARWRTRGWAVEQRHILAGVLMLCSRHHRRYDRHEMEIMAGPAGATGALTFRDGDRIYREDDA